MPPERRDTVIASCVSPFGDICIGDGKGRIARPCQADTSTDGNTSEPIARHAGDHGGAVVELHAHSTVGTEILDVADDTGDGDLALGSFVLHHTKSLGPYRVRFGDGGQ